MSGEFEFIAKHLRPLSLSAPGAHRLTDDVATLPPTDQTIVVSADMLVAGVHFLADDPYELVARKAIRVNVSDVVAKGAAPFGYFLSISWPEGTEEAMQIAFVDGLRADQDQYAIALLGGDTTRTKGPLTVAVTMLGQCAYGAPVLRSGARVGDDVYVTGTIGDGVLGLAAARGELAHLKRDHADYLCQRYRLPQPRAGFAQAIAQHASAAIDVSDGVLGDLDHIATLSQVQIIADLDRLPLSPAASAWVEAQETRDHALMHLATGGDDYELAFTAPVSARNDLSQAAARSRVSLARIGDCAMGGGVRINIAERIITSDGPYGYSHF